MNRPDLCKKCGGKCCTDPFFTTEEYITLVSVIGTGKAMAAGPRPIPGGWKFRPGSCPGQTDTGCILPYEKRPLICKTYPFLPIPTKEGRTILALTLRTCPAWREFGELYQEQVEELAIYGVKIG